MTENKTKLVQQILESNTLTDVDSWLTRIDNDVVVLSAFITQKHAGFDH